MVNLTERIDHDFLFKDLAINHFYDLMESLFPEIGKDIKKDSRKDSITPLDKESIGKKRWMEEKLAIW